MENNVAANADVVEEANVAEAALPQKKQKKPINQQKLQDNLWGWIFCIPLIVGTVWFVYICLVAALLLSFTDYSIYGTKLTMFQYLAELGQHPAKHPDSGVVDVLGLYKYAFTHTVDAGGGYQMNELGIHLFNTVFYMIGIPIGMVLSMFFAVCMSRDIKGANFFRVLYYLPSVASTVAIVFTFYKLFQNGGAINSLLGAEIPWFQMPQGSASSLLGGEQGVDPFWMQGLLNKTMIVIMMVWKGLGGTIILYIAGLSGVNASTKEAAQIDGANGWQIFWKVTMPDLYPVIFYNIVTSVIGGMQIYAEPELFFPTSTSTLEIGGSYLFRPNLLTSGYVSLIWFWGLRGIVPVGSGTIYLTPGNNAVSYEGLGAAYGMVLAIIILVLTLFQFWLDKKNAE